MTETEFLSCGETMKKVYVYSKSMLHEKLMDRYRVDVDERNYRRKDGGCGSKGCVCGYPLGKHVEWGVIGHPDWIVEVEESPSGGIVILVPGNRCWFERGRDKGLQDRSQTDGSLYEFGIDSTKERELCDEFGVPDDFRDSFLDGLLYGLQASWRDAIKKRDEGEG